MSETRAPWTPGTWQVVEDLDNGTDYYWITTKELLPHDPVDHEWAITNKADAHLIASAPSLYEALEKALRQMRIWVSINGDMVGALQEVIDEGEAAIALAKGETK